MALVATSDIRAHDEVIVRNPQSHIAGVPLLCGGCTRCPGSDEQRQLQDDIPVQLSMHFRFRALRILFFTGHPRCSYHISP